LRAGGVREPGQRRSPVVGVPHGGGHPVAAAESLDQRAHEAFDRVQKFGLLLRGESHAALLELEESGQNLVGGHGISCIGNQSPEGEQGPVHSLNGVRIDGRARGLPG